MKIKLPEFHEFEEYMVEDCDERGKYFAREDVINGFPFQTWINMDSNTGKNNNGYDYMYGCISQTQYYDDAIITSDDIIIEQSKTGKNKISSIKKAYNQIVKQLQTRYKQWVVDNIMDEKVGE